MKRTRAHQRHLFPVTACILGALLVSLEAKAAEVTVARYSTVQPAPSMAQRDPLAAPVVSVLPASVTRIGEAVETLLGPSGYRLASPLAAEAERAGLVARVIPAADLMAETLSAAEMIGCWGKTAVIAAREAVERAQEGSLREGLLFERRTYYALWATADANEGMQAFLEKRTPVFSGR